jgi:elongation of very long chain fatty acids protein 4
MQAVMTSEWDGARRVFPFRGGSLPSGVTDLSSFWSFALEVSDHRVEQWPLMGSPTPTMVLVAAYLLFVLLGSLWMRGRSRPLGLRGAMVLYNVSVVALNLYMLQGFVSEAVRSHYGVVCNPLDPSEGGLRIAHYVYVYFLSKIVDFVDTVFIVLRKKRDQLSFLHVYHHASMLVIWWVGVRWGNSGDAIFGPLANCFVHTIMYGYYLATTLRVKIPGKRFITQLQMLQFFFVMAHSAANIAMDCDFPQTLLVAQMVYLSSLFALFINFYWKTFRRPSVCSK